jgi:cell wall-associated NlpC family hydrolase
LHSNAEVYLNYVLAHAHEIDGPPKPADVVMFRFGRVYSHGAIVIDWPRVVHSLSPEGVRIENVERCTLGPRAMAKLPRKYFSLWG